MTTRNSDKACTDCRRDGRVHTCTVCGARRCPHYSKHSDTGYCCRSHKEAK
jgi:hypothetical protein